MATSERSGYTRYWVVNGVPFPTLHHARNYADCCAARGEEVHVEWFSKEHALWQGSDGPTAAPNQTDPDATGVTPMPEPVRSQSTVD